MPRSDVNLAKKKVTDRAVYANTRVKRKERNEAIHRAENVILNSRGNGAQSYLEYAKQAIDKEAGKRLQKFIAKTNRGQK